MKANEQTSGNTLAATGSTSQWDNFQGSNPSDSYTGQKDKPRNSMGGVGLGKGPRDRIKQAVEQGENATLFARQSDPMSGINSQHNKPLGQNANADSFNSLTQSQKGSSGFGNWGLAQTGLVQDPRTGQYIDERLLTQGQTSARSSNPNPYQSYDRAKVSDRSSEKSEENARFTMNSTNHNNKPNEKGIFLKNKEPASEDFDFENKIEQCENILPGLFSNQSSSSGGKDLKQVQLQQPPQTAVQRERRQRNALFSNTATPKTMPSNVYDDDDDRLTNRKHKKVGKTTMQMETKRFKLLKQPTATTKTPANPAQAQATAKSSRMEVPKMQTNANKTSEIDSQAFEQIQEINEDPGEQHYRFRTNRPTQNQSETKLIQKMAQPTNLIEDVSSPSKQNKQMQPQPFEVAFDNSSKSKKSGDHDVVGFNEQDIESPGKVKEEFTKRKSLLDRVVTGLFGGSSGQKEPDQVPAASEKNEEFFGNIPKRKSLEEKSQPVSPVKKRSSTLMHRCKYCAKDFVTKKDQEEHVIGCEKAEMKDRNQMAPSKETSKSKIDDVKIPTMNSMPTMNSVVQVEPTKNTIPATASKVSALSKRQSEMAVNAQQKLRSTNSSTNVAPLLKRSASNEPNIKKTAQKPVDNVSKHLGFLGTEDASQLSHLLVYKKRKTNANPAQIQKLQLDEKAKQEKPKAEQTQSSHKTLPQTTKHGSPQQAFGFAAPGQESGPGIALEKHRSEGQTAEKVTKSSEKQPVAPVEQLRPQVQAKPKVADLAGKDYKKPTYLRNGNGRVQHNLVKAKSMRVAREAQAAQNSNTNFLNLGQALMDAQEAVFGGLNNGLNSLLIGGPEQAEAERKQNLQRRQSMKKPPQPSSMHKPRPDVPQQPQPQPQNTSSNHNNTANQQYNSRANMSTQSNTSPSPQTESSYGCGKTQQQAMFEYADELTPFEKSELGKYPRIYCVGSLRVFQKNQVQGPDSKYKASIGEQIGYRYQITKFLDEGAFGQVFLAVDYKEEGKEVALKISRSSNQDFQNAESEGKFLTQMMLKCLESNIKMESCGIVTLIDSFSFRGHYVIAFELLGSTLLRHLQAQPAKRLQLEKIRDVSRQLLQTLDLFMQLKIIHCDLKPENILFTDDRHEQIKIVDYGTSCTSYKEGFMYVQSRFYRCPEIVLGMPYDQGVDMWSFGCIIAELYTGNALFPARDQRELVEWFHVRVGELPIEMRTRGGNKDEFYLNEKIIQSKFSQLKAGQAAGSMPLRRIIETSLKGKQVDMVDETLMDFIEKCLVLDPKQRWKPNEAIMHPWITGEAPKSKGYFW